MVEAAHAMVREDERRGSFGCGLVDPVQGASRTGATCASPLMFSGEVQPFLGGESNAAPDADDDVKKSTQREVLVIVDDDASVLRTMCRQLAQTDYEVRTYEDGQALLDDVEAGLRFDVMVTDIVMPGLSGIDLVRRLEAAGIVKPTVFVSGYSPDDLDYRMFQGRAFAFLQKPFKRAGLTAAIDGCRHPSDP